MYLGKVVTLAVILWLMIDSCCYSCMYDIRLFTWEIL